MKFSQVLNIVLGIAVLVLSWLYATKSPTVAGFTGEPSKLVEFANNWNKIQQLSGVFKHEWNSVHISNSPNFSNSLNKDIEPFSNKDLAVSYVNNYLKDSDALKPLQDPVNKKDFTSSMWFSGPILGEWIRYMLENHCDGVRMYFSKYTPYVKTGPDNDPLRNNSDDQGKLDNRFSVIFAMTADDGAGGHKNLFKQEQVTLTNSASQRVTVTGYSGLYNYSNICPPYNCPATPLGE